MVINHGHTRTGFANARLVMDWRKRRCACGEAVRLPDKRREELCEAKSQEAARRASALVCGSSQRFQRLGVEEEFDNIHPLYAVMVERRVVVEREQELGVVVANGPERGEFARERGFVAGRVRHLKVEGESVFERHEIDFSVVENPDIDFAEPTAQFKVNDIFKQMAEVFAFRSEKGAAKPRVGDVVLRRCLEILTPLDVVTVHPVEEECLAECVDVGVQRRVGHGEALAFEHSDDLVHRKQIADVVEEETDDALERGGVAVAVPGHNVLVENRIEDAGEVVELSARAVGKLGGEREAAETQKVVEYGMRVPVGEQGDVFREVKWLEAYFDIASGEERGQFAGEELGVGAGDIDIEILAGVKPVNELFELRNVLYLVEKNVCSAIGLDIGLDELPRLAPAREGGAVGILEIDCDYPVCGKSAFNKLFAEKLKKRGFPATAYAGHDFDDVFVSPSCEPVDEPFSPDLAIVHGRILVWHWKFDGMIAFSACSVNGLLDSGTLNVGIFQGFNPIAFPGVMVYNIHTLNLQNVGLNS